MIIHSEYEGFKPVRPVVTVGVFDGVHRGHRVLIEKLVSKAAAIQGESVIVTFSSHPRFVLGKDTGIQQFLTTFTEKAELLRNLNVDHVLLLDFNIEFSRTSACEFVRKVIAGKLGTEILFFGYDHRIGKDGEGDFSTIRNCEGLGNLKIEQAGGVFSGEVAISSTSIKEALLIGNVDIANELLGYSYFLSGYVISGRMIGRKFGFPTANIEVEAGKLIPANGVYAVNVGIEEKQMKGVLSIGTNPTINPGSTARSIEVHIIDFDGDLYGKIISLHFRKRIRNEMKFPDVESLVRQMEDDKIRSIRYLSQK